MTGISEIARNLDWSYLIEILKSAIPALICIVLHELSHGAVAYLLGDDTAKRCGRLTLNPLKHIDPFGLLMMATVGFGWAKPVPVDLRKFKNPKRDMAITALAGPASNFLIAFICICIMYSAGSLLYRSKAGTLVFELLYRTAYLSIGLGVFNLIPVPPLDGSKIAISVLDDKAYYSILRYERFGFIILAVIVASGIINAPLNTAIVFLFEKMSYFISKILIPFGLMR